LGVVLPQFLQAEKLVKNPRNGKIYCYGLEHHSSSSTPISDFLFQKKFLKFP